MGKLEVVRRFWQYDITYTMISIFRILLLVSVWVIHSLTLARADEGAEKLEFFENHIRPVLSENCYQCHGSKKQESGLRVDHIQFLSQEGEFGPILVPGKPEMSNLYRAITHQSEELQMPYEKPKLSQPEIEAVFRWIADGAMWPEEPLPSGHSTRFNLEERKQRLPWIWEVPKNHPLPGVEDSSWPQSSLDFFILNKLEEVELKPNLPASPATWLRRAHFAITGLPPSPEEIQDFLVSDHPGRKEAVVEALLDSPHFGERWARHWMDLVRYAESRGHESDFPIANAWHYRDYLIRAFNEDVPYDQFITEHLAGDLLENPRLHPQTGANESLIATGWPFFGEEVHSPVDIRQDESDRTDNKVDVLSKTFLGLTVACARCHDHKFDAITQKDYYSLTGFILSSRFSQTRFESQQHNLRISDKLESLRESTRNRLLENLASFLSGEKLTLADPEEGQPVDGWEPGGESSVILNFDFPDSDWYVTGLALGRRHIPAGQVILPESGDVGNYLIAGAGHAARDAFWNGLKIRSGNENDSGNLDAVGRSSGTVQTKTFTVSHGQVHILMQGEAKVYAGVDAHLMVAGPLHGNLVKTLKADKKKWVVYDLNDYIGHRVHFEFGPVAQNDFKLWAVVDGPISDTRSIASSNGVVASIEALRSGKPISSSQAESLNRLLTHLNEQNVEVPNAWKKKDRQILDDYWRSRMALLEQVQSESRTAISLSDGSGVDEHVLSRGKYQRPKELARRGIPTAFGAQLTMPKNGSGRLELARSLTDPSNPLVARVMVNRIWHHIFGRGIVASVDNFGWLGERPTHPDLLDHMAWQFMHDDEWSIKSVIRRLVLSSTFAMSSQPMDSRAESQDPKNQLLHRMPVRRLEAEVIRDAVLAVSGRLNPSVHGKPIPVHLTEFVVGRGRPGNSGPLDGDGRRSIYTSVRRNFLPTMMLAFDSPIPFSTVGRRNVTNVPAQSLAMMNDKFIYQQAEFWAKSLENAFLPHQSQEKIEYIYLQAFARHPNPQELNLAQSTLEKLADFHQTSQSDSRVWHDLCHTIFRLNEFIYLR